MLSSPLESSAVKLAWPKLGWAEKGGFWSRLPESWRGFCPCCKRPVDMRLTQAWSANQPKPYARGNYAYVINLWGASPAYILGALVLGHSIKKTGSRHSRVCLHTPDVPEEFLALLRYVWDCRPVEHIDVVPNLSVEDQCERFEKVFTKLNGMKLTEFAKILVMDIDLLVRGNIDELFELSAPAAMKRGMNDSRYPMQHGQDIDARCFFLGKDSTKWSWGVGTGINAGVMLWQPDYQVFQEMLEELTEANHPEHMRGNGPEQDYLSRFWADAPWSHIGVDYNFQLHQMFFSIHPDRVRRTERAAHLTNSPEKVKIVHYSGVPTAKPWHRILDDKWAAWWPDRSLDKDYTKLYAEEFQGYWLWVKRDTASFESATRNPKNWDVKGMYVSPSDGEIYRQHDDGSTEHLVIPQQTTEGAMNFLDSVLREWFDALQEVELELGINLQETMRALSAPASSDGCSTFDGGRPSAECVLDGRFSSTGGTEGQEKQVPAGPAGAWSPALRNSTGAQNSGPISAARSRQQFTWDRPQGGWWFEANDAVEAKTSVMCGALTGRHFVSFLEGGEEVFAEDSDVELSGVFIKVAGPHSTRVFKAPAVGCDEAALAEALAPMQIWAQGVPKGAVVLLALLAVPPEVTAPVLEALGQIGVPRNPPPASAKALAAVGCCRGPEAPGAARGSAKSDFWYSTHASIDIAYAAMPWQGC